MENTTTETANDNKIHVPAEGRGSGLIQTAVCGRGIRLQTGRVSEVRNRILSEIRGNTKARRRGLLMEDPYCTECVARAAKGGWLD